MLRRITIYFRPRSVRYFSLNPEAENDNYKEVHPLRKSLTESDVLKFLSENIIYQGDDIAVFNKPAGLGLSEPKASVVKHFGGQTVGSAVYLEKIMDKVSALVPNLKNPSIAKFPERYTSGIMILAGSEEVQEKVAKCRRRAKSSPEFCEQYLAVTIGKPIKNDLIARLAIEMKKCPDNSKKIPFMVENWSKKSHEMQKVIPIHVGHTLIQYSHLASLNRAYFSTQKANAMRLYFATKMMSPLLGDFIFGSRVNEVMGHQILIDPWSDVANSFKKLPKEILNALQLSNNESLMVPLCVHLTEVQLPKFKKGKTLILRAPPPPNFIWICQKLGLPRVSDYTEPRPPRKVTNKI